MGGAQKGQREKDERISSVSKQRRKKRRYGQIGKGDSRVAADSNGGKRRKIRNDPCGKKTGQGGRAARGSSERGTEIHRGDAVDEKEERGLGIQGIGLG